MIYLGGGWALTAKHVGEGEIHLSDETFTPELRSRHILLNVDGSLADALLFELDRSAALPDMPLVPIARTPPRPGEEVVLIGWGRGRGEPTRWSDERTGEAVGFRWTGEGRKRWGTNRVLATGVWVAQGTWLTRTLAMRFDPPEHPDATRFEAHAATGDSGGGIFVRRAEGWELAGMMISVSGSATAPPGTSAFGDRTFGVDLSSYRSEILRWARPACANEEDDDGDGLVDHPDDPDCESEADRDERRDGPPSLFVASWRGLAGLGLGVALIGGALWLHRQRGRSTPSSTSPSSAS